jgi:hypothetical protein
VKITREVVGTKRKTETVTSDTFQGYALAEKLSSYVSERVGKSPEAEPFFRFVFEILKKISGRISNSYILPKSFFAPSSLVVRRQLRQGPAIKLKNGTLKGNTYVPFSFAKSSECTEMPETLRKTLTGVGANVVKQIDSINLLDLQNQSWVIPYSVQYLNLCYSFSDELRKSWQNKAEILDNYKCLDLFSHDDILCWSEEDLTRIINTISKTVIKTRPLQSDKDKQSALQKQIADLVNSRKKSRKTSS